ncbi:glycosyltransferase family 2 protein [Bacteroides sp.]|uniref:glycosyltransferase family 2 protein n=1 Tax=Bacteroides sp. TaxID=29523 RepID=UPI003AB499C2
MVEVKYIDISVVIPVYNAEVTIIDCLNSVIDELENAKYFWEIILVDDGSTDSSAYMLKQYKEQSVFKNSIHIFTQLNQGVSAARNVGLLHSKGDYVAFNDSDDRWLKGRIKKQISFMRNNKETVMVAGLYRGMLFKNDHAIVQVTIKKQIFKNHFSPTCVLLKRTVLAQSGLFDQNMRYGEDVNFFNRIVRCGKCFLIRDFFAESILNKYVWGDSGLSSHLWEMEKGELKNLAILYSENQISLLLYIVTFLFSIGKYCRRFLISCIRH